MLFSGCCCRLADLLRHFTITGLNPAITYNSERTRLNSQSRVKHHVVDLWLKNLVFVSRSFSVYAFGAESINSKGRDTPSEPRRTKGYECSLFHGFTSPLSWVKMWYLNTPKRFFIIILMMLSKMVYNLIHHQMIRSDLHSFITSTCLLVQCLTNNQLSTITVLPLTRCQQGCD